MSKANLQQSVSLHEQQLMNLLRDWVIYLRARLQLLTYQPIEPDPFEQDSTSGQRAEAEQILATLPATVRMLCEQAFQSAYDERQEATEAQLKAEASNQGQTIIDPIEIERLILQNLLHEASKPDSNDLLIFPMSEDGQITWMALRASTLHQQPDQHAYQIQRSHHPSHLQRIGAILAIVGLIGFALWRISAPETSQQPNTAVITLNATPIARWPVSQIDLVGTESLSMPLKITNQYWPATTGAFLSERSGLPLQICLSGSFPQDIKQATLHGNGLNPDRIYRIEAMGSQTTADLLLLTCSDGAIQAYGSLEQITLTPARQIGESQIIDQQAIRLTAVRVIGAAEDPRIPQGAAQIECQFETHSQIDWARYRPTLRLSDASQQTAPQVSEQNQEQSSLRFLITAPVEATVAAIQLTDPNTHQVINWQLSINRPRSRSEFLSQVLQMTQPELTESLLIIPVTNQSNQAIQLSANDFLISIGQVRQTALIRTGLEMAINPGETRLIQIEIPENLQAATLQIGSMIYSFYQKE